MRLLNVNTRDLHELRGSHQSYEYAILSHRWEQNEVTFQDLKTPDHRFKLGYFKIDCCCRQAEADGLQWIWVDTCCINKDSSAELSEAVNSMFDWYRDAKACYVYLADVSPNEDGSFPDRAFRQSLWFTRGWTLQELLAPKRRVFYDESWSLIGAINTLTLNHYTRMDSKVQTEFQTNCWADSVTRSSLGHAVKDSVDLTGVINQITGINESIITHCQGLRGISVAEKMAWASDRKTTVVEDIAYCLLGIFEVNMPPLYGEGDRAFARLQREIVRDTYDHSIFAWGFGGLSPKNLARFDWNLLAKHPDVFRVPGPEVDILDDIIPQGQVNSFSTKRHYSLTNLGLHIELPLIFLGNAQEHLWQTVDAENKSSFALGLLDGPSEGYCVALPLYFLPEKGDHRRAVRCKGSAPLIISTETAALAEPQRSLIYLAEKGPPLLWSVSDYVVLNMEAAPGWRLFDYFPPMVHMDYSVQWSKNLNLYGNFRIILVCYHHHDFGSFLLLLTNHPESFAGSVGSVQQARWAMITSDVGRGSGTWETLMNLANYKEINMEKLSSLKWGSYCEFSSFSTGATYRVSLRPGKLGFHDFGLHSGYC